MRASLPPLQFSNEQDTALRQALNDAANHYLLSHNDHRYADSGMFLKLFVLSTLCLGLFVVALHQQYVLFYFICYLLFIMTAMLLAINVVHDASHNVFFKSAKANTWLNRIVTIPLGIDPDCWRVRHVLQHHAFTNIEYYDLDIDYNGFLRQTPYQIHHWFMRYQHYYWPVIAGMTFPTIIWCFDWQDRLGFKFNKSKFTYPGFFGWVVFLLTKALHIGLAMVIPILFCPQFSPWLLLVIYCLSQMCSSFIFVTLILGTHWAKATFYQAPIDQKIAHSQTLHAFNTTLNWRLKCWLLEYWLGGLNLHLTHHLYPGFSHRHYQYFTLIVHQIAEEYGIDYRDITLTELFKYQQRFLKEMGIKPCE